MVVCLEQGADLHMVQLMPLPLTVSCFSKIQTGFTFLVLTHLGSPGQRAVKRVCKQFTASKSKNQAHKRDSLGGNVKGNMDEMCFKMSFKHGKSLSITSNVVCGIHDGWFRDMESTRVESKFHSSTVRRLAEVEQRNVDGAYGMRMSDKYDTVPEKKNLVCKCGKYVSYVIYPFHSVRVCQNMCNSVMLLYK